jgi:hypothetical protein
MSYVKTMMFKFLIDSIETNIIGGLAERSKAAVLKTVEE